MWKKKNTTLNDDTMSKIFLSIDHSLCQLIFFLFIKPSNYVSLLGVYASAQMFLVNWIFLAECFLPLKRFFLVLSASLTCLAASSVKLHLLLHLYLFNSENRFLNCFPSSIWSTSTFCAWRNIFVFAQFVQQISHL